jgi:hypothetical protein
MLPKKFQNIYRRLKAVRTRAGLGLITQDPIERGGFVIEYIGPVLSKAEADTRGGRYLFETSANRFIDGKGRDNLARYINHSCRPNCEVEVRRGRVFVFARRPIEAGEELGLDYGEEYFNEFIKPLGCKCDMCAGGK